MTAHHRPTEKITFQSSTRFTAIAPMLATEGVEDLKQLIRDQAHDLGYTMDENRWLVRHRMVTGYTVTRTDDLEKS